MLSRVMFFFGYYLIPYTSEQVTAICSCEGGDGIARTARFVDFITTRSWREKGNNEIMPTPVQVNHYHPPPSYVRALRATNSNRQVG